MSTATVFHVADPLFVIFIIFICLFIRGKKYYALMYRQKYRCKNKIIKSQDRPNQKDIKLAIDVRPACLLVSG